MKNIKLEFKLTDLDNNISVTSNAAGGLPSISSKIGSITVNGGTDEEVITKLFYNILASFYSLEGGSLSTEKYIKAYNNLNLNKFKVWEQTNG